MSEGTADTMYPRNTWYPIAWGEDLQPGQMVHRKVLGEPVLLVRTPAGSASALYDVCPHRQAPLHLGRMTAQGHVQCGYHGLEFDGSGQCVHNPHGGGTPAKLRTRSFPLVERHSILWIWMGDAQADPAAIPDFGLMEDKEDGLTRGRAYIHIAANYLLVADNLLDLSHANYLHDGILGLPEHSNAQVKVVQEGQTIVCTRSMPDVPIARLHDLLYKRDGRNIDMWNTVRWSPPSALVLTHGFSRPGGDDPFEFSAVHLLTPETESSTHYSYGIVRRPALDDEESVKDEVAATRKHVFEDQDRVVLEAQQKLQDEYGAALGPKVLLGVDSASVRMRRVIAQMLKAEQPAPT